MSVIVNNTVLSNFSLINRLDLLKNLSKKVYLTSEVYKEVNEGIECGYDFQLRTRHEIDKQEWLFIIDIENPEFEIFFELSKELHLGESSCLAIAKNRKWTFFTDDGDARYYAEKLNVELSGTIGILASSIRKKLITLDEGEDYLQTMIKNGYRSPIKHLSDIL